MTHAHGRRSPRHPDEDELVRAADASVALRRLLAAAAAPPSAAELEGRSRAIAEFRSAQLSRSPEAEPGTRTSQDYGGHRTAAGLTLVCTAVLVVLGGAAANAVAGELPTALRNAVAELFADPAPADHSPSPGGSSSEHPLHRRPG